MAAAAGALPLLAGKFTAEESAGMIKGVMDALSKEVVGLDWELNPKTHKMELVRVRVKITVGFILGLGMIALLWEVGNWFAKSIAGWNGGNAAAVPDVVGLLTLNPTVILLTDLFGNAIKDANGNQKSASAPPTFGAAFNMMMRDLTVAGPGNLARQLLNVAGAASAPKPGAPTSSSSSFWNWLTNSAVQKK